MEKRSLLIEQDQLWIDKLKQKYIEDILKIQIDCGIFGWFEKDYVQEIDREDSVCLVGINNLGKVAGFILTRLIINDKYLQFLNKIKEKKSHIQKKNLKNKFSNAEILNFGVKSASQKKGFGQKLLTDLFNHLENRKITKIWLEVRKRNTNALGFYQKNGFIKQFTRKDYYRNPTDDAFILKRESPIHLF